MATCIGPTEAALAAFGALDQAAPIACLNLLAFREQAAYAADDPEHGTAAAEVTGAEAYDRYGTVALGIITAVGGRVLLGAGVEQMFIGPAEAEWERAVLVFYPSRAAFAQMLARDDYRAAGRHRIAGLANTRLIMLDGRAFAS